MSSTCALSMRKNGPAWTISTQLAIAASRSSTTYAICLMTPCSIAMAAPGLRHADVYNEHTRVADDALLIVAEDGDLRIADRDVGRQQLLPRCDVERAADRRRLRERGRKRERQDQRAVVLAVFGEELARRRRALDQRGAAAEPAFRRRGNRKLEAEDGRGRAHVEDDGRAALGAARRRDRRGVRRSHAVADGRRRRHGGCVGGRSCADDRLRRGYE